MMPRVTVRTIAKLFRNGKAEREDLVAHAHAIRVSNS